MNLKNGSLSKVGLLEMNRFCNGTKTLFVDFLIWNFCVIFLSIVCCKKVWKPNVRHWIKMKTTLHKGHFFSHKTLQMTLALFFFTLKVKFFSGQCRCQEIWA